MRKLLLLVLAPFASEVLGESREELEVGFTFREMRLFIEAPNPKQQAERIGLTKEEVETAVKSKLSDHEIRTTKERGHGLQRTLNGSHLYVDVHLAGSAYHIEIALKKSSFFYNLQDKYRGIHPSVYQIKALGIADSGKEDVLKTLDRFLEAFIRDYLDSNLKYEQTYKTGHLLGVDKVILSAISHRKDEVGEVFITDRAWAARYNKLPKPAASPAGNGSFTTSPPLD